MLTALGWVLSYTALRQLALSADMPTWAATLWPSCIDRFVFVATLAAIRDRRRARSTTYSWTLSGLYSAATVAGNVTAAGADHMAQAAHATPPVTMVLAWHLLSRFFTASEGRRGGHQRRWVPRFTMRPVMRGCLNRPPGPVVHGREVDPSWTK